MRGVAAHPGRHTIIAITTLKSRKPMRRELLPTGVLDAGYGNGGSIVSILIR